MFDYLVTGLMLASVWAVVAIGFNLVFGITKMFHFAYGAVFTVSAYVVYAFAASLHAPLWLAFVVSIVVTGLLGLACEFFIYRPLRRRQASHFTILIASIGLMAVIQNAVALIWGDNVMTIPNILDGHFDIAGVGVSYNHLAEFLYMLALAVIMVLWLHRTKIGMAARAIGHDDERAQVLGIPKNRVYVLVMLVTSVALTPMALLQLLDTGVTPYDGTNLILIASIAAFAGGIGSVSGALIAAMIMGLISGLAIWIFPSAWQNTVVYLAMFILIILKPRGLFGKRGAV